MNVLDVKPEDLGITGDDPLKQIFQRQLELMKKYHEIEKSNGLLITEDVPVNLHDAKGQYRLKDFAWRITEEIGEAIEAYHIHPDIPIHFEEEIADALHFLTEFTILAGATDAVLQGCDGRLKEMYSIEVVDVPTRTEILVAYGEFEFYLSIACNCLKNKPWKITQMMTDIGYFYTKVMDVWEHFIFLCCVSGIPHDRLLELYFRKSEVNKFRQRSAY